MNKYREQLFEFPTKRLEQHEYSKIIHEINTNKSPKHLELLQDYLSDHEEATVSDILRLISTQSDFYDDDYIEKAEAVAI